MATLVSVVSDSVETSTANLKEQIDEAFEMMQPRERNEAITQLFDRLIARDDRLEKALFDVVVRLRSSDRSPEVLKDSSVIYFNIRNDESGYEGLYMMVAMMEYIVHAARRAVDTEVISGYEYMQLRELLAKTGIPFMGLSRSYVDSIGGRFGEMETQLEKRETARRLLLDKFKEDANVMAQFELLGLTIPVVMPKEVGLEPPKTDHFHFMISEFCKFLNLTEEGAPIKAHVMKFILDYLGMVPRLNGGFSALDLVVRKDGESEEEFRKRVGSVCENITRKISAELGDSPLKYRMSIIPATLGEIMIEGIEPNTELVVLDKNVQGFISNINKGGKGMKT